MIVITNRIPVAMGHEIDFEDRLKHRVHLVDRAPGFVRNEVHRPRPMRFDHESGTWTEDPDAQGYCEVKTRGARSKTLWPGPKAPRSPRPTGIHLRKKCLPVPASWRFTSCFSAPIWVMCDAGVRAAVIEGGRHESSRSAGSDALPARIEPVGSAHQEGFTDTPGCSADLRREAYRQSIHLRVVEDGGRFPCESLPRVVSLRSRPVDWLTRFRHVLVLQFRT
jgi:hypothetical protein